MDLEEVINAINVAMFDSHNHSHRIEDKPKGEKQESDSPLFDYEYVDQVSRNDSGDSFYGSVYYPLPSGKYLAVSFEM